MFLHRLIEDDINDVENQKKILSDKDTKATKPKNKEKVYIHKRECPPDCFPIESRRFYLFNI